VQAADQVGRHDPHRDDCSRAQPPVLEPAAVDGPRTGPFDKPLLDVADADAADVDGRLGGGQAGDAQKLDEDGPTRLRPPLRVDQALVQTHALRVPERAWATIVVDIQPPARRRFAWVTGVQHAVAVAVVGTAVAADVEGSAGNADTAVQRVDEAVAVAVVGASIGVAVEDAAGGYGTAVSAVEHAVGVAVVRAAVARRSHSHRARR
jgi:hypothetical protein